MRLFACRSWTWLVLGLSLSLGCSADPDPGNTAPDDVASAPEDGSGDDIKVVAAASLPPLGDALPTLDKGRVAGLAPPQGWEPLTRDNEHLARFATSKTNPNDLPRILVTAVEATGFTDDVTADNVAAFAESLAAEEGKKYLESPKGMIIGDNSYARDVTEAKKGSRVVERQVLETVYGGRRYAITLEVYSEHLVKNRDFAYAVAAGAKYQPAPGAAAPAPMPETPSDEKKAE